MRLVFAIPTWNREQELYQCVKSIAEQNPDAIYIADNDSTDQTEKFCAVLAEAYPCVIYRRFAEHVSAEENLRRVIDFAEGDYIWTFGDDDILLPGALKFVYKLLELNLDFYHVTEEARSLTNTTKLDTLLNLCCNHGFIEMTGFMTGNITRASKLKQACATKNWEIYKRSAFSHSLMLLETLAQSQAMLVDVPIIRAAVETQDTVNRWEAAQTNLRYIYIADGLILLRDAGVINGKLPEIFFRYLDTTLIVRMMNEYIARTFNPEKPVTTHEWKCMEEIIRFIEEPRGSALMEWFKRVEAACLAGLPTILQAFYLANDVKAQANTIQMPEYPYTFLS